VTSCSGLIAIDEGRGGRQRRPARVLAVSACRDWTTTAGGRGLIAD
jgi:hypothetical protein